jgi:group I intron endonuclease
MKQLYTQSVIYKISNKINNKIYIGQAKNITKRLYQYKYYFKTNIFTNKHLTSAIKKFGLENFEFSILEYVEENNLSEREIYWISHFDSSNNEKGYNKTLGGDGLKATPEIKLKISISLTGKKHTEERNLNQSLSQLNNKHTQESKDKLSKTNIERFKNIEAREKQGIKLRKPVIQYSLQGDFIKEWISTREVEKILKIDRGTISKCCNGKGYYKSAGGYIWKYKIIENGNEKTA